MTDIDTGVAKRRALTLLKRALKKAGIAEERANPDNLYPPLFGGTRYYWRDSDGDVELVLNSAATMGGQLHASLRLGHMALNITTRYSHDNDAVNTLAASIAYMVHSIGTLLPEVHYDLMIRVFNALPKLDPDNPKRQAIENARKMVLEPVRSAIEVKRRELKKRVQGQRPRGGNTRTKQEWRGDQTLKRYAQRVNDRTVLAERIKYMYDECDGEDGWVEDLARDTTFQMVAPMVSPELISWAIRRVASDNLPAREREPKSVACEIARQELELPEQDIETLRTYYTNGNKLLKQERKAR